MNYCKDLPSCICFYCGQLSTCRDHIVPVAWLGTYRHNEWSSAWVQSCSECNTLLSDCVFDSLPERLEYLKARLLKRYKKVLSIPEWTPSELVELEGEILQYVIQGQKAKAILHQRLQFDPYAEMALHVS